jgi:hypothetical protein
VRGKLSQASCTARSWAIAVAISGVVALALSASAGCAPAIDGPIERQRAIDR